jgi:hypothetical protein
MNTPMGLAKHNRSNTKREGSKIDSGHRKHCKTTGRNSSTAGNQHIIESICIS